MDAGGTKMAPDKGKWTGLDGAGRSARTENAGVASSILALGTSKPRQVGVFSFRDAQ